MLYLAISYLPSVLLLLFIVITVLFKPSLFKRFYNWYCFIFNFDYEYYIKEVKPQYVNSEYFYADELDLNWINILLFFIILIPFIFIPVLLIILFFKRMSNILKN